MIMLSRTKLVLILALTMASFAYATPVLKVFPDSVRTSLPSTFQLEIRVGQVDSLYAFAGDIVYNSNLLEVIGLSEGTFMNNAGRRPTNFIYDVNNSTGSVIVGLSIVGNNGAPSSANDTTLFFVTFRAKTFGADSVRLDSTGLIAPNGRTHYPCTIENGFVSIIGGEQNGFLYFSPQGINKYQSQNAYLNIDVSQFINVFSVAFDFLFDPNLITVDTVTEGPFLSNNGHDLTNFQYDNSHPGRLIVGITRLDNTRPGADAINEAIVARIKITCNNLGSDSLRFANVGLVAPDGRTRYNILASNGNINVLPPVYFDDFEDGFYTDKWQLFNTYGNVQVSEDTIAPGKLYYRHTHNKVKRDPNDRPNCNTSISSINDIFGNFDEVDFKLSYTFSNISSDSRNDASLRIHLTDKAYNNLSRTGDAHEIEIWSKTQENIGSTPITDSIDISLVKNDSGYVEVYNRGIFSGLFNIGALSQAKFRLLFNTYSDSTWNSANLFCRAELDDIFKTSLPNGVDLYTTNSLISFLPDYIKEGDSLRIYSRIYNMGTQIANNVTVHIYDGHPSYGGLFIGACHIGAILPRSYSIVTTMMPTAGKTGSHDIYVKIDPNNEINELDEFNNLVYRTIHIWQKPDLFMNSQYLGFSNSNPTQGETIQISGRIYNIGEYAAKNVLTYIYLDDPNHGGAVIDSVVSDSIPGLSYLSFNKSFNTTGHIGSHMIIVQIDPYQRVDESNINNNSGSNSLTISNPSLNISLTAPPEADPGDSITAVIALRNNGLKNATSLRVMLTLPNDILFAYSTPSSDSGGVLWRKTTLKPDSSMVITIRGFVRYQARNGSIIDLGAHTTYKNQFNIEMPAVGDTSDILIGQDTEPPQFIINAQPSIISIGAVTLTVSPSEPLIGTPAILATGHLGDTLVYSGPTLNNGSYIYAINVLSSSSEGTAHVSISGIDLASNIGSTSYYFIIDQTAPIVSVSCPPIATIGNLNISVNSNESLINLPTINVRDAGGHILNIGARDHTSNLFNFVINIPDTVTSGTATIYLSSTDLAGNAAADTNLFIVDRQQPIFSTNLPSILPSGTRTFTLYSSKRLRSNPTVTFKDHNLRNIQLIGPTIADTAYIYRFTIDTLAANGIAILTVVGSDSLGNIGNQQFPIGIDRVKPSFSITVNPYPPSGDVVITIVSSEGLMGNPLVTGFGRKGSNQLSLSLIEQQDSIFQYATNDLAITAIKVQGSDHAGNVGSDSASYCDLGVGLSSIRLSGVPAQGSDITAYITVHNLASVAVESVLVKLYSGYPGLGNVLGGSLYLSIPSTDSVNFSIIWSAADQRPSYVLYLLVDENNAFKETNELNNASQNGSIMILGTLDKSTYVVPIDSSLYLNSMVVGISDGLVRADNEVSVDFRLYRVADSALVVGPIVMNYESSPRTFRYRYNELNTLQVGEYFAVFTATDLFDPIEVSFAVPFRIIDDFHVSINTDRTMYNNPDSVIIEGLLRTTPGNIPIGQIPVQIRLQSRGGTRSFNIETDNNGSYKYVFTPLPNEAGRYTLSAYVQLQNYVHQDTTIFNIQDFRLSPNVTNVQMSLNSNRSISINAINSGENSLSGFAYRLIPLDSVPWVTATIDASSLPTTIDRNAHVSIPIVIEAGYGTTGSHQFYLEVSNNENMLKRATINITTQSAQPILRVTPNYIEYILNAGDSQLRTVTISNIGYDTCRAITISPGLPVWLDPAAGNELGNIPPNSQLTLDLFANIPDTMLIGIYNSTFTLTCANHQPVQIGIRAFVTSDSIGSVRFKISDPGDALISGANVRLYSQVYDPVSHSYPVISGSTNDSGAVDFVNIPASQYSYRITKSGYFEKTNMLTIMPTGTLLIADDNMQTEEVTLDIRAVEISWSVQETTITDQGIVTLNITYIPVENIMPPQLIIVPYTIAHSLMPNESVSGAFSITNIGQMPADNISIELPSDPDDRYTFDLTGGLPSALEDGLDPGEYVTIEYQIHMSEDVDYGTRIGGFPFPHLIHVKGDYQVNDCPQPIEGVGFLYLNVPSNSLRLDPPVIVDMNIEPGCNFPGLDDFANISHYEITATNSGFEQVHLYGTLGFVLDQGWCGSLLGEFSNAVNAFTAFGSAMWYAAQTREIMELFDNFGSGSWTPSIIYPSGTEGRPTQSVGNISKLNLDLCGGTLPSYSGGLYVVIGRWGTDNGLNEGWAFYSIPYLGISNGSIMNCLAYWLSFIPPPGPDTETSGQGGGGYCYNCVYDIPDPPGGVPPPEPSVVRIVIEQELAFERDAFTAHLDIHNSFESYNITNFSAEIEVLDEYENIIMPNQYLESGPLYFSAPTLSGVDDIAGNGTIVHGQEMFANWLIIPKQSSGGTDESGKVYYLRAKLSFDILGHHYVVNTIYDDITVKPQPSLDIQYMLPRVAFRDEPFRLGVRISNNGHGTARNLRIDSQQPVILEGQDLMERFEIIGSSIGGVPGESSYLINFGDILPGSTAMAYWTLVATPIEGYEGGLFTEFRASYVHDNALGGQSTSLVNSVRANLTWRDNIEMSSPFGFLVDSNLDSIPDEIVNSETGDTVLVAFQNPNINHQPTFNEPWLNFEIQGTDGWFYTSIQDPFSGSWNIDGVYRSNSTRVDSTRYWRENNNIYIVDQCLGDTIYSVVFNRELRRTDLAIWSDSIIISPAPIIEEDTAFIGTSIRNIGSYSADSFYVRLYDGAPDSGGILIGAALVSSLAQDSTVLVSASWPTAGLAGEHRIYVTVDSDSLVADVNRSNNMAIKAVEVLTKTDLSVAATDIGFSPSSPVVGDTVMLSALIHNGIGARDIAPLDKEAASLMAVGRGVSTISRIRSQAILSVSDGPIVVDSPTSIANSFYVRFYDGSPDSGGTVIDSIWINTLGQDSSLEVYASWPTLGQAGHHQIYVAVDAEEVIRDVNRANNLASKPLEVKTKTDLYLASEDISFNPANPVDGDTVAISAMIHNGTGQRLLLPVPGPVTEVISIESKKPSIRSQMPHAIMADSGPEQSILSLADSFYVRFYDGSPDSSGILIDSVRVASLAQDSSVLVSAHWHMAGPAGEHRLYVTVDADSSVQDINRANNSACVLVSVLTRTDLSVASTDIGFNPENPVDGDTVMLSALIHNGTGVRDIAPLADDGISIMAVGKNTSKVSHAMAVGILSILDGPGAGDSPTSIANSFYVRFYDGSPDSGGTVIDSVWINALGQDSSLEVYASWPTLGQAGHHHIYVAVDAEGVLRDVNRANNVAFRPLEVKTKTDLYLASEDIGIEPISPVEGDTVAISALIHNGIGQPIPWKWHGDEAIEQITGTESKGQLSRTRKVEAARADSGPDNSIFSLADSFYVRLYDGAPDSGGILIGSVLVSSLAQDSTALVSASWPTAGLAGEHRIYVTVDSDSLVADVNRSNNMAIKQVIIETLALGAINGVAYNSDGVTPLPNVHVVTYDADNNSVNDQITGAYGTWNIVLSPGTYREHLSKLGFQDADIESILVTNGNITNISITMQLLGGCHYVIGDANGSATFTGLDVTYSVRYFKGGPRPPYSCNCPPHGIWYVSGDVNGSCTFSGLDVTYMVRYFKGGAAPIPCADCPPSGLLAPPNPDVEPIKTPY
jgi:subtilase family serine protease